MIKKVKLSDCTEGLWKNGQGKTRQVAIYPHGATLEANDFLWRLSSATILKPNEFSSFEGRNRWLIVWKGSGLILNDRTLSPHTPLHFLGEEKIQCSQLHQAEEVIDLGLIYDRNKIQADLKVLHHREDKGEAEINAESATVFLFLAKGTGFAGKLEMVEGDFLILENRKAQFKLTSDSLAYEFSIKHS